MGWLCRGWALGSRVIQPTSDSIAPPSADERAIPGAYWIWLGGVTLSLLGTHVLAFAMAWVAAGRGGLLAGLVLTMINLPRTVLLLAGGAVGDQFGAWRTMVAGDAVMTVVTVLAATVAWLVGVPVWLLLATALAIGVVDAFYLPSSGSMPRRLVAGPGLARAMAARQLSAQLTSFAGAPLGGVLVVTAGLAAAAVADAATFAVMLLILVILRLRDEPGMALSSPVGSGRPEPPPAPGMWRQMVDGVRVAVGDQVLHPALLLVVLAAGLLLPVSGLVVPLLRASGAGQAWRPAAWPAPSPSARCVSPRSSWSAARGPVRAWSRSSGCWWRRPACSRRRWPPRRAGRWRSVSG